VKIGFNSGVVPPLDQAAEGRRERVLFALAELGIASTSGVLAFVGMVYRFAPERMSHVQRVAALAVATGSQLGLRGSELAELERAALVHDLGKLVLPDPPSSKLVEWAPEQGLATRQAIVAADLLASAAFLRPASQIVRAMCEWTDGSGQPRGLSGEEIPAAARILGVADSLDVMTSVCRDLAWPRDLAVVELVRQAGVRFDAKVIAAALEVDDAPPVEPSPWLSEPRGVV
jgi:HD-GYP domain-containing protein (c-di-GMP phosphodiesterase class II)